MGVGMCTGLTTTARRHWPPMGMLTPLSGAKYEITFFKIQICATLFA